MKIGNVLVSALYIGDKVLTAVAVGATKVWEGVSKYIKFADPAVEAICLANWDADGDGFLSKEEAKAVTSLGTAFNGNTEITSFDELVDFENVKSIDTTYAFGNCTNLQSIDLTNIEYVASRAFTGCPNLISVGDISNFVTMGNAVFYNCSSLSIEVNHPKLTGRIGWGAYSNTGIKKVVNLGNVTIIGSSAGGADQGTFAYCKALESVVLPNTIEEIGPYCFEGCTNLTHVMNIEKVKRFGNSAFSNCTSLVYEELNFPYLEVLGDNAFADNYTRGISVKRINNLGVIPYLGKIVIKTLEMIRVPSTVTSCAGYAFANCSSLKTLVIEATSPFPITTNFLRGTPIESKNGTIYVPDASVEAYKAATNWAVYASRIKPLSEFVEPTNE